MQSHAQTQPQMDPNGAGNGGSRWNPTKDQVNILEGLYKQGLRTPTAQQIQQITARLRDFGHIEGKNVFYWFQNHKARQRQKQKQIKHDNLAYFGRFIHPVFPPFQNVVCSPCYYPEPQPPAGDNNLKRPRPLIPGGADQGFSKTMHEYHHRETLDLFPIHPTGIIGNKKPSTDHHILCASTSSSSENDNDQSVEKPGKGNRFFDFFCRD